MPDEFTSPDAPQAAPPFTAAIQPSYVRTLFLGPDGLRPGWGLAFFVLIFYLLQPVAVRIAWAHDYGANGLWSMLLEELGVFVAALLPTLVLAQVERRSWGVYGLPLSQTFGKLFWIGALGGFAGITLLIFSLRGLNSFDYRHLALHGPRIVRFAAYWALLVLLVSFFEEFLFRGYAQFTLN